MTALQLFLLGALCFIAGVVVMARIARAEQRRMYMELRDTLDSALRTDDPDVR